MKLGLEAWANCNMVILSVICSERRLNGEAEEEEEKKSSFTFWLRAQSCPQQPDKRALLYIRNLESKVTTKKIDRDKASKPSFPLAQLISI